MGRARAEGTVIVTASAFPIELWKVWDGDCKSVFGDCRWIKMWNDHVEAKNSKVLKELLEKIDSLNQRIIKLEQNGGD